MLKSTNTTGVLFTSKPSRTTKPKRPITVVRPDTPRPTDEDIISFLTEELTLPTVKEEEDHRKKTRPTNT